MTRNKMEGMIAATFTPMKEDGCVDAAKVKPMVDRLVADRVKGIFVCGSTGEGPSLTTAERKLLVEAFVQAAGKRIKVFVHVGHNSVAEAKDLAAHAQKAGADYISATPPCYFKINTVSALVDCLAEIASGAPEMPFYYYNIPALTGVALDMVELLRRAAASLPTLAGIKYTTSLIHEYQACLNFEEGAYDLLYGTDEMLLSALVVGAKGYIGSTYNFAAPLYEKLQVSFDKGDIRTAQRLQMKAVRMVQLINKYGGLAAQKTMMKLAGTDCGPVRLPLQPLEAEAVKSLEKDLQIMGFFNERS
ncbi:MAG TPA: dihydrodipicolinate synthase family protein [Chitinophagaceae bacterium]|jgi:N-acetylneuraminate lyase|nr:dihydrodipicolinate synthase family protein [Chitinophagaceae bacterium]